MPMLDATLWWLFAGIAFMALEAFGASGIGFFFAGLAAILVALVVKAGVVATDAVFAQFAWFFGLTVLWAAVLWKPLRNFHTSRKGREQPYTGMVGDTAIVGAGGLTHGKEGIARWSGTTLRAELAVEETEPSLAEGTPAIIVRVEGNIVFVKRK